MSLNKVMLIGRLGADPELKYSQSGTPVARMRIATSETYTDREGNRQESTEWHTVVVFQRQAENCANYLSKGSMVYVEGSLQTRQWQDQQGQNRYTTEIKGQRVQFLDRKGDGPGAPAQGGGERRSFQQPQQSQQRGGRQAPPADDGFDDLGPAFPSEVSGMDDVPF
ncbi:single-strand binding protein [Oleidesulfovibrio alaskensis G20]|jgi:single-strand DNA-binding protein|uniref:Single-stranded DNA-binding protein n=1 Tax=Oleidesulfovibrio alaskensis (strain ATCC BAA-1058 / DSM 17464 / G20) TaxID=207559 RepID=Q311Q4_OLEA2|nr:single-stranded DNA-binding protein [Oleidesulfovibrio alaskensis]ABB38342.1 single-strand binding protein [Oleidesulfovibrio alaskensis G20]MBG0774623.1 single-stranded DNA-binding protein [Oleidesulfovibrio alaskensis]MBL3582360.1 single-stranded DNA-binding protein [Oleidesulfovibrio alaskensis]